MSYHSAGGGAHLPRASRGARATRGGGAASVAAAYEDDGATIGSSHAFPAHSPTRGRGRGRGHMHAAAGPYVDERRAMAARDDAARGESFRRGASAAARPAPARAAASAAGLSSSSGRASSAAHTEAGTARGPPRIPTDSAGLVRWLENRKKTWDQGKMLYELQDRHAEVWAALCEDNHPEVVQAVIKLLAHPDLTAAPEAAFMYMHVTGLAGISGLQQLMSEGALSTELAEEAVLAGSGSRAWAAFVEAASDLVSVLGTAAKRIPDSIRKYSAILEGLESRLRTLLKDHEHVVNAAPARQCLRNVDELIAQRKAAVAQVKADAAMAAATEEARKALRSEKLARARAGITFLDDPEHDLDYKALPVMPSPEELLAPAPAELPLNLVAAASRTRRLQHADAAAAGDEDALADALHRTLSSGAPVVAPYRSVHHLVNTHFLLLRHDSLAQLREGLATYRQYFADAGGKAVPAAALEAATATSNRFGDGRATVYVGVRVIGTRAAAFGGGVTYEISFNVAGRRSVNWAHSSLLKSGSLLCLSPDGTFDPETFILATVAHGVNPPDRPFAGWVPTAGIAIDLNSTRRFDPASSYVMMESPVYFEAYQHVLRVLQTLADAPMPFASILTKPSAASVYLPQYLFSGTGAAPPALGSSAVSASAPRASRPVRDPGLGWYLASVFPSFRGLRGNGYWHPVKDTYSSVRVPELPPFEHEFALDTSQRNAIGLALSREVALIQGPPGTGKTFVGVLIARILLANDHLRRKVPILFLCQTNHALDQILEHVHKFNRSIIRIGGRSQSEVMQQLSLQGARQAARKAGTLPFISKDFYAAMDAAAVALAGLQASATQRATMKVAADAHGSQLTAFPNGVLLRLNVILGELSKRLLYPENTMVHRLLDDAPGELRNDVTDSAVEFALDFAKQKREAAPAWATHDGPQEWSSALAADVLATLAAAAAELPNAPNIVDQWRARDISAKAKAAMMRAAQSRPEDSAPGPAGAATASAAATAPTRGTAAAGAAVATAATAAAGAAAAPVRYDEDGQEIGERDLADAEDGFTLLEEGERLRERGSTQFAALIKAAQLVAARPVKLDAILASAKVSLEDQKLLAETAQKNPWKLGKDMRARMARLWAALLVADGEVDAEAFSRDYNAAAATIQKCNRAVDRQLLKQAAIVGVTTTGAAKYGDLLRELDPEVVMVEEAAEVLEAHILTALTPSVKHMVLIGDHQQLRPQVAVYDLARHHALDVSLFERLINAGVPHVTLTTQRRMHPSISSLIRSSIYARLRDAPSTHEHPPVRGIRDRLFFWHHDMPEDGGSTGGIGADAASKRNSHEAKMAVRLLLYLLLNGYDAEQLVVLSMYKGQVRLTRELAQKLAKGDGVPAVAAQLANVRMTTTDNFQGEEKDVVILSLVRSSASGSIGFVGIGNRINVGLSRARHGMYVLGNFRLMRERQPLWETICAEAERQRALGPALALQCYNHPESAATYITMPEDFNSVPLGGCRLPCNGVFDECGHACPSLCHSQPHSAMRCMHPCEKPRPTGCTHGCSRPCSQPCPPCTMPVRKVRPACGHIVDVPCHKDPGAVKCPEICGFSMACGHTCTWTCHGHDPATYVCKQPCLRTRVGCKHACTGKCNEPCKPCAVPVKHSLPCGHTIKAACSADLSALECKERCCRKLACGHQCTGVCGRPCTPCDEPVSKPLPRCGASPQHTVTVECRQPVDDTPCMQRCGAALPCGHTCTGACNECNNGVPGPSSHPPCESPCAFGCAHGLCQRPCGDLCAPCPYLCSFTCAHAGGVRCDQPCPGGHAAHALASPSPPCDQPCSQLLACGHACLGICGETCPALCSTCHPAMLAQRTALSAGLAVATTVPSGAAPGAPSVNADRFLQPLCGHAFTVAALDNVARPRPTCPECHALLVGIYRYEAPIAALRATTNADKLMTLDAYWRGRFKVAMLTSTSVQLGQLLVEHFRSHQITSHHLPPDALQPLRVSLLGQIALHNNELDNAKDYFAKALRYVCSTDAGRWYLDRIVTESSMGAALAILGGISRASLSSDALEACGVEALEKAIKQLEPAVSQKNCSELLSRLRAARDALHFRARQAELRAAARAAAAAVAASPPPLASAAAPRAPTRVILPAPRPVLEHGGNELHYAALYGTPSDIAALLASSRVRVLTVGRDALGRTPLALAASRLRGEAFESLLDMSPWEAVDSSGMTAIDYALAGGDSNPLARSVRGAIQRALADPASAPIGRVWAVRRADDKALRALTAMDEVMALTGLTGVKRELVKLVDAAHLDKARPPAARIMSTSATHFVMGGNPGTGKTTVARLIAKLLQQLKLRNGGNFEEATGQQLLDAGPTAFASKLKAAIPGVLFVDEVYQLDPRGNPDGKAITNAIMQAAEEHRTELSIIVAGYKQDIIDKWMSFNAGLPSRFTYELEFEDFTEDQLHDTFITMVEARNWCIDSGAELDLAEATAPPAATVPKIAARRLVRAAGRPGFANARSVRALVERSMRNASARMASASRSAASASSSAARAKASVTLIAADVLGAPLDLTACPELQQLESMVGLTAVKSAVKALVKLVNANFQRELAGQRVLDVALHRVFLGNPGTGKTSIAKLYGSILRKLGLLSNGEVVVVGASKLTGDVVGGTAKKVNDLLNSAMGKVLVIDEAYVLASSIYGKEALDTLVERVQCVPGEDFAVIMCGYETNMKEMFRTCNPGLSRRFKMDEAFRFEDYTDDELVSIMLSKAKERDVVLREPVARAAVRAVLAKQRAKPNFGNAGAVNNLLDAGVMALGRRCGGIISAGDELMEPDFFIAPVDGAAQATLDNLVNADHIREHVRALELRLARGKQRAEQRGGAFDTCDFLRNYCFVGSPGTGKTTVARIFADIFCKLGLLSDKRVVEVKAMDLIGQYVGQTAPLVNAKMEEAAGGVLFIDEAYGLTPSRGSFASDAIQTLLANLTDPRYKGKMMVIFAGYQHDIDELLRSNPGLRSRFSEKLEFRDWLPMNCVQLLASLAQKRRVELPVALHDALAGGFADLTQREGWANARDVEMVFDKMLASLDVREPSTAETGEAFTLEDVTNAMSEMARCRPRAHVYTPPLSGNPAGPELFTGSAGAAAAPEASAPMLRARNHTREAEAEAAPRQDETKHALMPKRSNKEDETAAHAAPRKDEAAVSAHREHVIDDETFLVCLEQACAELGYDCEKCLAIVTTQAFPEELVTLVVQKVGAPRTKVVPMLRAQCPVLVPRFAAAVAAVQAERERLAELERELKRARDAAARAELERLEARRQERLRRMGRCPMGYDWSPVPGGGYRCHGGSHFVSAAQMDEMMAQLE